MSGSFTYEPSYEHDGEDYTGGISAFNLHGHGLDLDEIEQFRTRVLFPCQLQQSAGDQLLAVNDLRRGAPNDGGLVKVVRAPVQPAPRLLQDGDRTRAGARPAVVVHHRAVAGRHFAEPVLANLPAAAFDLILVVALLEGDVDPRGYVYLCRECGDDFTRRYADAQRGMSA